MLNFSEAFCCLLLFLSLCVMYQMDEENKGLRTQLEAVSVPCEAPNLGMQNEDTYEQHD